MKRHYGVYALYEEPVLMEHCWTKGGAFRAMDRYWHDTRWWLDYEVRKDGVFVGEQPRLRGF